MLKSPLSEPFPLLLLVTACLMLLPAAAFAYGGGGGGGMEGNVLGVPAASGEESKPPGGFDPSANTGLDDMFSDYQTGGMNTSSAGSSDDQRGLEDEINEQAGIREQQEAEQDRLDNRPSPAQQVNQFLDTLPPAVQQQLLSQYDTQEILTIRNIQFLQQQIRTTTNPMDLDFLQQTLVTTQHNFVKSHNIRLQQRQDQLQQTQEDFDMVCGILAGIGVNIMTAGGGKAGLAANLAYNYATGGARGAGTSAVSSALTSRIPGGNVAVNAVRDQFTQMAVDAAIEPDKAH